MKATTKKRRRVIDRLKKRARGAALTVNRALEDMDCGIHLAGFIRPSVARAEAVYDNAMKRLQRIDPDCPGYTGRHRQ
jgi:hypothetical protein